MCSASTVERPERRRLTPRRCGFPGRKDAVGSTGLDDAAEPCGREARCRLDRDRVGAPEPRGPCSGAELLPQPGVRKHVEVPGQRAGEIEGIVLDRGRSLGEASQVPEQEPAAGCGWDDRQIQLAHRLEPARWATRSSVPGSSGLPGPSRDVSARIVDAEVLILAPGATSGAPKAGWCTHMYSSGRSLSFVTRSATTTSPRPGTSETTRSTSSGESVEADPELDVVAAVGCRGDRRSPRERARLAVVGVVDATMARGPSARGEQDLPASRIRVEPRLRRALPGTVGATACGAPRASSRARRRPSGGPRLRGCRRLDRATASPGSGRRRARRRG